MGSGWLAVNSGQWAVYSRQRALNSRQWEVDNKQVAVGSGLEFSKIIFIPRNFAKFLQAKFYAIFGRSKFREIGLNFAKISYFAKLDIEILWPP